MSPWHIADALFAIKQGVPERLCGRMGVGIDAVRAAVKAKVDALPQQVRAFGCPPRPRGRPFLPILAMPSRVPAPMCIARCDKCGFVGVAETRSPLGSRPNGVVTRVAWRGVPRRFLE